MSQTTHEIGRQGENLAADFILKLGWIILERNYRHDHCEVDIIAQDGDEVVFVEVKLRRSNRYGWPEEAVTKQKISHLKKAMFHYRETHAGRYYLRLDVISIEQNNQLAKPRFTHLKNFNCN